MKLLLTGGTGFIGSRLALEARRRQVDVTVTGQVNNDAERSRAAGLERAGVRLETGPLQDAAFSRRVVAGRDTVIHLAAAQHESGVPDSYFEEVNVVGTRTLLDASREARVRRFVYGSTIGIYGSAAEGKLDESSPPNPDNVYGRTKLAAERVVQEQGGDVETCIVRISETYGPGDFRLLKLFRAVDRGKFLMIGSGENRRQVMYVDDLVRALLLAAEHPAASGEVFVMPGDEVLTTRQMVDVIAEVLGRRVPRVRLPMWPFLAAAALFEATFKPLGMDPPLHRRRLDFFRKSFVFSTDKAQRVLGFAPLVPFRQGARETAEWYRAAGYLGSGAK
jgi:nucleoside-diphosphate-sugar epimerase